jgi:MFS family permease
MSHREGISSVFLDRGFIALSGILLVISAVMAVFFQLQGYLLSLGISPRWTGFIMGVDSLAALGIQPLLAPFLDFGNARRWLVAGILVLALSLALYGQAGGMLSLVLVRILQGAGFICIVSALMALVVRYIPPHATGQAFGLLSLVRLVPYALVPPAVNHLLASSVTFTDVLLFCAPVVVASLGLLTFGGAKAPVSGEAERRAGLHGLRSSLTDRTMVGLLIMHLLVFTGYTVVFFYLAGYGKYARAGNPGFFFTTATVAMIAVRAGASMFFDKAPKGILSALCLVLLAVAYGLLGFARGPAAFFCLALMFGIGWGVVMPLLGAMVFEASEPRLRGMNLNLGMAMMQGAFFLGPWLGGILLSIGGYAVLFGVCGIFSLMSLGLVPGLSRKRRKESYVRYS